MEVTSTELPFVTKPSFDSIPIPLEPIVSHQADLPNAIVNEHEPTELPAELWYKIMVDLDPYDINMLGRVSKQLNTIVTSTPPYSDKFHDTESVEITIKPSYAKQIYTIDDLDILSLKLHATPLTQLTCTLECPMNPSALSADYRRLAQFILKCRTINRITLKLESRVQTDKFTDWVGWEGSLSALLNACVSVRCTSLEIIGGNYPLDLYLWGSMSFYPTGLISLVHKPTKVKQIHSDRATRWGWGWDVTMKSPLSHKKQFLDGAPSLKLNDPGHPSHDQFIQPNLTRLDISTPLLVHPPFSNWTYQVIASSPSLEAISIRNIPFGEKRDLFWRALFSWLRDALGFHNNLKSLSVGECPHLPTDLLLGFAQAFKGTLTELDIRCQVTASPSPSPSPNPNPNVYPYSTQPQQTPARASRGYKVKLDLPNLTSLTCTWTMVVRLAEGHDHSAGRNANGNDQQRQVRTPDRERVMLELLKVKFPKLESLSIDDGTGGTGNEKRLSIFRLRKY